MDDETALLRLMERFLTRQGHEVTSFERGEEAWRQFSQAKPGYDLVILDLTLPDITGESLLNRMLAADSNVKALVCSGTPGPGITAGEPRIGYLQKPFLPNMLTEAVNAVLGRPRVNQTS